MAIGDPIAVCMAVGDPIAIAAAIHQLAGCIWSIRDVHSWVGVKEAKWLQGETNLQE